MFMTKKGRLRKPENHSRVETRLVIRPFTVKVNCQIGGLASIRKGLGKENTPFLVSSNIIIASENVSGRVSGDNFTNFCKPNFTNPEGSQSGRVPILPIRKGPNFANSEGSHFCKSGGVSIWSIRKGPNFANPEGSKFCQFARVRNIGNPEGSQHCQSGGVLFCQSGGVLFVNPEGYYFIKTEEKKIVQVIRLLRDRLGNSDCSGNLPFIKDKTKTKQV